MKNNYLKESKNNEQKKLSNLARIGENLPSNIKNFFYGKVKKLLH